MIDVTCPSCGSDNTVKCSVAWERGTSKGQISGVGVDLHGDVAGFGGVETMQTAFAAKCAPPIQPTSMNVGLLFGLCAGIALIVGGVYVASDPDRQSLPLEVFFFVSGAASAIICLVIAMKNRTSIRAENNAAVMGWANEWICQRCGSKFNPKSEIGRADLP